VQCGLCCKLLKNVPALSAFDHGNGVCRYLAANNLCEVYHNRPMICDTEKMYASHFKDIFTRKEYIRKNLEACIEIAKDAKALDIYYKLKIIMETI
jgi:Fe-S-cluster containining protein